MQNKDLIRRLNSIQRYDKPKPKTHKQLRTVLQDVAKKMSYVHSGHAIFITAGLNLGNKTTIQEEWLAFRQVMPKVVGEIDKAYAIAGLVLGVEMYVKNKGRANNKSFKPHAHIVLLAYNQFMSAPIFQLREKLIGLNLDVKMDHLEKPWDVASAITYTAKSAGDPTLSEVTHHFLGIKPTSVYINTALEDNPLFQLKAFHQSELLPMHFVEKNLFWKVPSVRRYADSKYSAAEFLAKLCVKHRVGFFNNSLLKRQEGTFYTWQTWKPVHQFIDALAKEKSMPNGYREFLLDNALWIINEGSSKRTGAIHTIFPRVQMQPNLWELPNATIYNFQTDTFEQNNATEFISCSKFVNYTYEELSEEPEQLMRIFRAIAGNETQLRTLLAGLGGLFHVLRGEGRKEHQALWIFGDNDTLKSWLINQFLKHCFHELLIFRLPQTESTFQFSALKGASELGVVYIDDFRSVGFRKNAGTLINVLNGDPVAIDAKYKDAEVLEFKGNLAITSNESIETSTFSEIDQKALAKRFQQIHFQNKNAKYLLTQEPIHEKQWFALAIAANKAFLQKYCHSRLPE